MVHYHPPLAAFPLALLSCTCILETAALFRKDKLLRSAGRINLLFALIFICAAFYSGYYASELADQTFSVPDEAISSHHFYGRLLLFAIFPCFALALISDLAKYNKKIFRAAYYFFLITCLILVLYTGYLGGELVFKHGAGVSAELTDQS